MLRTWCASVWSFFSLDELQDNRTLQSLWWVFLAYQVLLFTVFLGDDAATTNAFVANQYTCWPWALNCGEWYALALKPALSQTIVYVVLFVLQGGAFAAALKNKWRLAISIYSLLIIWEAVLVFFLSYEAGEAYIYLHILLSALLLMVPLKRYAMQLIVVLLHMLGALMEWYRYWFLAGGSAFSLPLLGTTLSVWLVNVVLVVQTIGILYLFSRRHWYRRGILLALVALHAYGALSFDENYFILMVPVLFALFWDWEPRPDLSRARMVLFGTIAVACIGIHLWIFTAAASLNFTFARPHLGVSMFFPQTSGISKALITYTDGTHEAMNASWTDRPCRCSPYSRWFELRNRCEYDDRIASIAWTLDLSLQRGIWARVVDVPNVCSLNFSILQHNDWIRSDISTEQRSQ